MQGEEVKGNDPSTFVLRGGARSVLNFDLLLRFSVIFFFLT